MNVFELFATLGLDSSGYESGLDRARGMASSVGSAIGAGLTAVAGMTTAAVGAAATGVVNLTTQAVNAYADYEQLVGGAEKLYGDAAETMIANAQNAYETTGLSANAYMQSVTTFSAALLNSLDGDAERAAEIADMAMRDLADNANTFGTMTAEELTSVYTALAKGNYTLLDNLNLGYAGSQQGMLDLINASGLFEETIDDINDVSFDQMLQAIHMVQEEMNITDTTVNEAAGTISGSITKLQGAWQNLLIGLGDSNADLGSLIDNVVSSVMDVVNNVTPVAEQAMNGIASLIDQLAPVLADKLPTLIETVLPSLLNAVTTIITSVAEALPDIASVLLPQISNIIQRVLPAVLSLIPTFIRIGGEIISAIITGLVDNAAEITQAGLDVLQTLIDGFAEATSGDGLTQLVDTAMQIIEMLGTFLVENAPTLITAAVQLITQLATLLTDPENLQMLIDLSLQLVLAVGDGLVQSAPALGNAVVAVIGNLLITLWNELPNILTTIGELLGQVAMLVLGLIGGLMGQSYDEVIGNLTAIWDSVGTAFMDGLVRIGTFIQDVLVAISDLWTGIGDFFTNGIMFVGDALANWWTEISAWFTNLADSALEWAGDLIDNFVSGLMNGITVVGDAVSSIADEVRSFLGFSEPEIGPLSNFHTYAPDMIDLFAQGIDESLPTLDAALNNMSGYVADNMPSLDSSSVAINNTQPIVVQAYFGTEKFDEYVINSNQRSNFIAGGRA